MYDRNNVVKNTQSQSRKGFTFRTKNCGILFRLLNLVGESRKLGTFTCAAAFRLGMAMGRVGSGVWIPRPAPHLFGLPTHLNLF